MRIVSDIKNPELARKIPPVLRLNLLIRSNFLEEKPKFLGSAFFFALFLCKIAAIVLIVSIFFGGHVFVSAPTFSKDNLVSAQVQNNQGEKSKEAEREELEAQLAELEKQIKDYENVISKSKQQAKTLAGEIDILKKKIAKINLELKSTQVSLKKVSAELEEVEYSLNLKEREIADQKKILINGLQKIYET